MTSYKFAIWFLLETFNKFFLVFHNPSVLIPTLFYHDIAYLPFLPKHRVSTFHLFDRILSVEHGSCSFNDFFEGIYYSRMILMTWHQRGVLTKEILNSFSHSGFSLHRFPTYKRLIFGKKWGENFVSSCNTTLTRCIVKYHIPHNLWHF